MIATGKIRITISTKCNAPEATEEEVELTREEQVVLAHALVSSIENSAMSVLELRIVVPSHGADTLLASMARGETEIAISQNSWNPDQLDA